MTALLPPPPVVDTSSDAVGRALPGVCFLGRTDAGMGPTLAPLTSNPVLIAVLATVTLLKQAVGVPVVVNEHTSSLHVCDQC